MSLYSLNALSKAKLKLHTIGENHAVFTSEVDGVTTTYRFPKWLLNLDAVKKVLPLSDEDYIKYNIPEAPKMFSVMFGTIVVKSELYKSQNPVTPSWYQSIPDADHFNAFLIAYDFIDIDWADLGYINLYQKELNMTTYLHKDVLPSLYYKPQKEGLGGLYSSENNFFLPANNEDIIAFAREHNLISIITKLIL